MILMTAIGVGRRMQAVADRVVSRHCRERCRQGYTGNGQAGVGVEEVIDAIKGQRRKSCLSEESCFIK